MVENHLSQILIEDKELKRFIKSYWVLKYEWKEKIEGRLNPLESSHIVINLGEEYSLYNGEKIVEKGEIEVFYPSEKICEITYPKNTYIVGIELSPQGLYYLTKEEYQGNIGMVLPLEMIAKELTIFLTNNSEEIAAGNFKIITEGFHRRLEKIYQDKDSLLIEEVLEKLKNTDLTIEELSKNIGKGIRTLERKFKRNTGLTMKGYRRIERLNNLLIDIYMKSEVEWAELAIKHGFSDQAHMIKELKKYIGNSPNEYLKLKDLLGDIFIVNDAILQ